ncbi:MAG: hypothetical protein ABFS45_21075, partial [Pseudomonadota bacterium]
RDVGVISAFRSCESVNYNALFPLMFLGGRESLLFYWCSFSYCRMSYLHRYATMRELTLRFLLKPFEKRINKQI